MSVHALIQMRGGIFQNFSNQGEPIAVDTAGRKSDQLIARQDFFSVNELFLFHHSHCKSRKIVILA